MEEVARRQEEYEEARKRKHKLILKGVKDHSKQLKRANISKSKILVVEMKNKVGVGGRSEVRRSQPFSTASD